MSEDLLSRHFAGLKSRHEDVRAQSALTIRQSLDRLKHEMTVESYQKLMTDVYQKIFTLVNSTDIHDRLGGVQMIGELLSLDDSLYEETEARLIRFANYLRMILQSIGLSDLEKKLIKQSAQVLGDLAEQGGVLAADTVEFEVKRSLEWLEGDRLEQRRYCAVCVLTQLAYKTPTLFNVHVGQFLDRVWITLRDQKIAIREVSAESLRACLLLVNKRSIKLRQTRYAMIYQEILASIRLGTSENLHAALLATNEMLRNSGDYLIDRFNEVFDHVWRLRDHKEKFIRDSVIVIIPQLASFSINQFIKSNRSRECLLHLIQSIRSINQSNNQSNNQSGCVSREVAFVALGEFALAVKDGILSEIDAIISVVKEGLTARSKKAFCLEALTCIAYVCRAIGQRSSKLSSQMNDVIEQMFSAGLSLPLVRALQMICQAMPKLLPAVQDRILTGLTVILASGHNQSNKDKNDNRRTLSLSSFMSGTTFSFPLFSPSASDIKSNDPASTDLLHLALATLGTFDFKHHNLLPFVRDAVLPFLDDERPRIRRRAAMSVAAIILQCERSFDESDDVIIPVLDTLNHSFEDHNDWSDSLLLVEGRPRDSSMSEMRDRHMSKIVNNEPRPPSTPSLQRVASSPSVPAIRSPSNYSLNQTANPSNGFLYSPQTPRAGPLTRETSVLDLSINTTTPSIHWPLIIEVMERLLTVAVSDPDPMIRKTVIDSLNADSRFDRWLSDGELIHSLFVALHDEVFSNRESAMRLIGRLALQLPSLVMPPMRKTLIQLLSELEFTGDLRHKEESALLLGSLIQSSQHLMRPYVTPILNTLTARLRSNDMSSPSVASSYLATLGDLATIGGDELNELNAHLDELVPLIVAVIQDKSSQVRKEVALHCLSSLISSTGLVVEPWTRFPHLLPTLLSMLRAGVSWPVRREILKLIGVLGAIDPIKFKDILQNAGIELRFDEEPSRSNDSLEHPVQPAHPDAQNNPNAVVDELHPASLPSTAHLSHPHEDYFPTVSLNALMSLLREPALTVHHGKAVQALTVVIKSMTPTKLLTFLPIIVPNLVAVIKGRTDDIIVDLLFAQIHTIVNLVKQNIRNFLPALIQLALDFLKNPALQHRHEPTFALIEKLSVVMKDDWRIHLPPLLPAMLSLLQSDRAQNRASTLRVLHAFEIFGPAITDYLHLVIPAVVRLAEQPDQSFVTRVNALRTLGMLARTMNMNDFAGRIVHPIARILDAQEITVPSKVGPTPRNSTGNQAAAQPANPRDDVLACLCLIVYQLGQSYVIFIPMISKILHKQNVHFAVYDLLVAKILAHQRLAPSDISSILPTLARISAGAAHEMAPSNNSSASLAMLNGEDDAATSEDQSNDRTNQKRLLVSASSLKKAWEVSQRSTGDDWQDWFRGFSIELLKESPAPSLRACSVLATKHHMFARDLFHPAFASCWQELSDEYQDDLVRCLEIALNSVSIPPELVQIILNLAEFMERDGHPLPIDLAKLGLMAENVHAYAKALHYKEQEFLISPQSSLDGLIGLHNELDQPEAAIGALQLAKSRALAIQIKESWLEKLQRWDEALEAYDLRALHVSALPEPSEAGQFDVQMGRMRCLRALGEWDRLSSVASNSFYSQEDVTHRREIAPMAAQAAWMRGRFDDMNSYLNEMEEGRFDTEFLRAIVSIHSADYDQANVYLERGRELLDTELAALVSESYDRAYRVLIQCQQLTELEEVIKVQQAQEPNAKDRIGEMWRRRLRGCSLNVDVWSALLSVRSLIQAPEDDIQTQLKFSSLCRKNGRMGAAVRVFQRLLPPQLLISIDQPLSFSVAMKHPSVTFAYLKHLWHAGVRETAHVKMFQFVQIINAQKTRREEPLDESDFSSLVTMPGAFDVRASTLMKPFLPFERQPSQPNAVHISSVNTIDLNNLRARAYLKLGEWQLALDGDALTEANITSALSSFHSATLCAPRSYKCWHEFAVMNFRCVTHYQISKQRFIDETKARRSPEDPVADPDPEYDATLIEYDQKIHTHVIPAIKGFFRSISLTGSRGLQDILRLLTLWFGHGTASEVEQALSEGFNTISIDTWLPVIPQIIARLDTSAMSIRRMIQGLLCQLGRSHPQALVYPLAVVLKTMNQRESDAAFVMADMRSHSKSLVDEALLVSKELIRVAILWHELWHEALEEASRLFFGQRNYSGMIAVLEPLHILIEKGAATLREVGFLHAFGRDLCEAREWTQRWQRTGYESDLSAAWDLYCTVFRRINKQITAMSELELQYVSPRLLHARNLQLAMPGTYLADRDAIDRRSVTIASFCRTLRVIESKQRPRKLAILGSDGNEYAFLLKGHEDLRQDKRVMQLFGLINGFLGAEPSASTRDLRIKGYSVIPLSQESGLIQWLHACDTMHALVKDYRESAKILLNIEHRLMLSCLGKGDDFPLLSLLHKVEVFEHALSATSGRDLAHVLWLHSSTSERWLQRRATYTQSLAVMSMVGYILGLGDRHPCNLMIEQTTGKVIHVDFGDCFEVAQQREKFPERIPFRLTRMLIQAMELSGIEGTYRTVCEVIVRILRDNKESVMAVLEAFVHDPLLGWRLLKTETTASEVEDRHRRVSSASVAETDSEMDPAENSTSRMDETGDMELEALHDQHDDHERPMPRFAPALFTPTMDHSIIQSTQQSVASELNAKALSVIARVESKLIGRDFDPNVTLDVEAHVDRLIREATSHVNLCQCYIGWCPFW